MQLKNGFFLGKDSKGYFAWTTKRLERILSTKFNEVIKEAENLKL